MNGLSFCHPKSFTFYAAANALCDFDRQSELTHQLSHQPLEFLHRGGLGIQRPNAYQLGVGCAENGVLQQVIRLRLGIIVEAAVQLNEVLRHIATAHVEHDAVDYSPEEV